MIEINITELEKEAIAMVNRLTDNKAFELRKEMIKFAQEGYWAGSLDYELILEFINDFFVSNQPELPDEEV